MTKAEQEAKDRHEAFEKEQAKAGEAIHLPRAGEPGAPDHPDFPKVTAASKAKDK